MAPAAKRVEKTVPGSGELVVRKHSVPAVSERSTKPPMSFDDGAERAIGIGALAIGVAELVSPTLLAIDLPTAFTFLGIGAFAATGRAAAVAQFATGYVRRLLVAAGEVARGSGEKVE